MKSQNTLKALLLLSLLALMTACGKSEVSSDSDFSSTGTNSTSTAYINCSQQASYSNLMKINIRSVVVNDAVRSDLMRLKFSSLTTGFSSGSTYIQMYRWKFPSTGVKYLDPVPLSFRMEALSSGAVLTNYNTTLKWSDLTYALQNQNSSSVADLITKTRITVNVRDAAAEYQVLKVVYYDANNSVIDQADVLMPLFSAHPSNYALEPSGGVRPAALQSLHPFRDLANQGYSATQILNYSNDNYCF